MQKREAYKEFYQLPQYLHNANLLIVGILSTIFTAVFLAHLMLEWWVDEKGKPAVVLLKVTGGEHAFPKDVDIFITGANFFIQEMKRLKLR